MGKLLKKVGIQKKSSEKKNILDKQDLAEKLKTQMDEYMEKEKYPEAVVTLANMVQKADCYDPHYAFLGAKALFYMADYDRAATWCKNALDLAPDQVEYHIFYVKIDLMRDMTEEALNKCEEIANNYRLKMTKEELQDLCDTVRSYALDEPGAFMKKYPNTAELFKLLAGMDTNDFEEENTRNDLLDKLRDKLNVIKRM